MRDEAALFAETLVDDVTKVKNVMKYLRIVEVKIQKGGYKSARHSARIGTDLDRFVVPTLKDLEARYLTSNELRATSDRIERFAQLPMCIPFLPVIDVALDNLSEVAILVSRRPRDRLGNQSVI